VVGDLFYDGRREAVVENLGGEPMSKSKVAAQAILLALPQRKRVSSEEGHREGAKER
jgi:hypothetical protein